LQPLAILVLVSFVTPWQRATILGQTATFYGFDLAVGLMNLFLVLTAVISLMLTEWKEYAYTMLGGMLITGFSLWEILDPFIPSLMILGTVKPISVSANALDLFAPEPGAYLAVFGGLALFTASQILAREVHGAW